MGASVIILAILVLAGVSILTGVGIPAVLSILTSGVKAAKMLHLADFLICDKADCFQKKMTEFGFVLILVSFSIIFFFFFLLLR